MIIKTYPKWEYKFKMHESLKLDYTSTSNGYKQAFKHKHIEIYLWPTIYTSINPNFNEN